MAGMSQPLPWIAPDPQTPAPRPARDGGQVVLVVRDLVLTCLIGIYDHEKVQPQRLRLTLELILADDATHPWTHGALVDAASRLILSGHTNLLESLAERLASLALADGRANQALIRLEKLDAFTECAAVGVEIVRGV